MNKGFFLTILIAIMAIVITWTISSRAQVGGARQLWDYKSIVIVRSAQTNANFSDWAEATGESVKTLPLPVSMPKKCKELGDRGWELISVTPMSNNTCENCAGFTSQIVYWFKRAK